MNLSRVPAAWLSLLLVTATVSVAGAPAGAQARAPGAVAAPSGETPPRVDRAPSTALTHTISSGERRYTLRLRPVGIRSPQSAVFVQTADGSLRRVSVSRTRAYLGSVDGSPRAVAVAVRRRDGVMAGQVTVDGRATVFFEGAQVTGDRGTSRADLHWPSSAEAGRNVTVTPAQLPRTTRRWDIGYDLDFSYLDGELGGSVARAMDEVELTTVQLLASYETNARLRPAIGVVVLRSTQGSSPYAGREATLDDVRTAWRPALESDAVDAVAYLHSDGGGGGVAYVGTIGGSYAVSLNGSGNSIAIIRHELGHIWGPGDNHTNGPEGPTIESGNDYARFDGTELASIFTTRDARLDEEPRRFPVVRALTTQVAPYATLDLRDRVRSGATVRLVPTRNDIDANGDRVALQRVPTRTRLGGRLVRTGDRVTYVAPRVAAPRSLDWFRYTVSDGRGGRATGVVLLRVSPA